MYSWTHVQCIGPEIRVCRPVAGVVNWVSLVYMYIPDFFSKGGGGNVYSGKLLGGGGGGGGRLK